MTDQSDILGMTTDRATKPADREPRTMLATTLRRFASISTLMALTLGFLGYSVSPLNAADDVTIEMDILGFSPADLEVETGTTVTWLNTDRMDYPVISGDHKLSSEDGTFESGDIPPGAAFTYTFNDPITIQYVCDIHPHTMTGSLKVVGDPVVPPATEKTVAIVEGSPNDTQSWGYEPKDLEIEVGTTVIFRNQGATDHTATADDGSFDTGYLRGGQAFSLTFTESTAINYFCEPHPWMTGTIVVTKPGEAKPTVPTKKPIGGGTDKPPPVILKPPVRQGNEPATWPAQIVEGSISDPQSWGYLPESMTVQAGDTVEWTNAGSIGHTVTATDGSFDSGDMASGDVFAFTFGNTGTFKFSCTPHPWMAGVVQVVPAGTDLDTVAPPAPVEPDVAPPGGDTTGEPTEGGSDPRNISDSANTAAWTLGAVGLAAGTGIAIFLVGALITALGALQLIRQRKEAPDEVSEDTGMHVIDLTETEVKVGTQAPVLVGAGAIAASERDMLDSVRAASPKAPEAAPAAVAKPAVAAKPAAKPAAKKPAAKKTASKASGSTTRKTTARKTTASRSAGTKSAKATAARKTTVKRGAGSSAGGSRVR